MMNNTPEEGGAQSPPVPANQEVSASAKPSAIVPASAPAEQSVLQTPSKPKESRFHDLMDAFRPNASVMPMTMRLIIVVQIVIALLLWLNSPFEVLPRPMEVWAAFKSLWTKLGLGQELIVSFTTSLKALGLATIITLILSYLTVMPFFRPIAGALSKGRFLSLVGFSFVFLLFLKTGQAVKNAMLTFSITVFYLTSMMSVVASIPKAEFDHARTLRMSEWRVVWEVVVLGTLDKALDALRQNAAIGWMMLTMVEGIVRSDGGVGVLLLNQYKYFHMPEVFAIQISILIVGLFQDWGLAFIRRLVCPYADLTLERK